MKKIFAIMLMATIAITMIVMWPTNKPVGKWEGELHGLVDARGSEIYQGVEYRIVLAVSNNNTREQYYQIEKETEADFYIDETGSVYYWNDGSMSQTGKHLSDWIDVY
jgi:hypothetical protein